MRLVLLLTIAVAGCAGAPPLDNTKNGAALVFARTERASLMLGSFASVDGHALKAVPTTISIQPGIRTVGYRCAIILDGPPPPTVTMSFAPGKSYVFHCTGERSATVEER